MPPALGEWFNLVTLPFNLIPRWSSSKLDKKCGIIRLAYNKSSIFYPDGSLNLQELSLRLSLAKVPQKHRGLIQNNSQSFCKVTSTTLEVIFRGREVSF